MSNTESYFSIARESEALLKDRGSKFIARTYRVRDIDEVKQGIEACKTEHSSARHWCYAYRLGIDGEVYRSSDDGEPSHSAGDPILREIDSLDLTNTLVVVIRYFGGTKLGVGGLIQAYGGAAKLALEQSNVIQMEVMERLRVKFSYPDMNVVMRLVKKYDAKMLDHVFEHQCMLIAETPRSRFSEFATALKQVHTITVEEL